VWDVNTGQATDYSPLEGYLPRGAPFSPDNNYLAYIYSPGRNKSDVIRILNLKTGKIDAELPNYILKSFVQFSSDSRLLAMGNPYSASLWDVSTWEQVDTHGGPTAGCGQYFTPQNNLLTLISDAGVIFTNTFDQQLQDMCGTAVPGATLVYYFRQAHKMVFVLGNEIGEVWVWGFSGADLSRKGSSIPFSLPYKAFLTADQDSGWYAYVTSGSIIVKNISGETGTTIDEQTDYQYRVALLPGQKLMALGSRYGSIHIWTMP
jgi:WD40 repeat protein